MNRDVFIRLAAARRSVKRTIVLGYDLAILLLALALAFVTRFSSLHVPDEPLLVPIVLACATAGIAALYWLGVYHSVTRYLDIRQIKRFALAAAMVGMTWIAALYMLRLPQVPRSIGFIWPAYLTLLWFGGRYAMASLITGGEAGGAVFQSAGKPVLIYGANGAGIALVEAMRTANQYRAVCFVDDNSAFWGQRVAGLNVHPPSAIAQLIDDHDIADACLAFQSTSRVARIAALKTLTAHNLNVKTVPGPNEVLNGRMTVTDIRPVNVNDLLERDAVMPQRDLIEAAVAGHSILITGAGGSIGSEICRQLLDEAPTKLVLLDHSEFALFAISQELIARLASLPANQRPVLVPVIGSILDAGLLRTVATEHGVDTIYHAAAYKHVPLLETNEVIGVANNVIGTLNVVQTAATLKLERMVMISTDKAVRPANVMGASKRAAEMIVQAAAEADRGGTKFGIVRFGNVLDSSGSVVQLFRRQIGEGRAVTVTHRDVTRFFMSIPEATQLVLQASAMAGGGEVFVLDMGEPIRIYDLAVNMIRLSGLAVRDERNPDGDIPIEIVGLRPGEKLYEELFVGDATERTSHPRIAKARERHVPATVLEAEIERLAAAIERRDAAAVRATLMTLVADDHVVSEAIPASAVRA
ncbi:MAG: polysaccharide biosynthesis protein [Pseudomonadota bacterium]|nr:polysaccharide biosynthesis protein [Pseudomonadota bacterium]